MNDVAQPDARVRSAISHWAPRFVANGVTLTDFEEVTAATPSWNDWCRAWSERAAVHERLGREALDGKGCSPPASTCSAPASTYFGAFLFVHDLPQMKTANLKAVECRRLALPHLSPPGERVAIPYEGKHLYGILRKPVGAERPGVVAMAMGLDSTKEECDAYEQPFLARGLATLAFDGPGQGEGQYEFAIRGDYEVAVAAVVELHRDAARPRHATRIGLSGVSLGGYYAPRAAAFEKRIKACMALGGPFNWVEAWDGLPDLTREAFRVRSRCATADDARAHAATLALEGVAQRITCPMFIMNGRLDRIVPCRDAERLAHEVKGPVELLIIEGRQSHRQQPGLPLAPVRRRLDGGAVAGGRLVHPHEAAGERVQPLDADLGDQHHLAGLHARLVVAGDDVGLDHHRLAGAERLVGIGPAGRLFEPRMGEIAAAIAVQQVVDDGEARLLDHA